MPDSDTGALNLRLPRAVLDRAAAMVPAARRLVELTTAPRLTRADVLRVALARGLAELELELAPQLTLPVE